MLPFITHVEEVRRPWRLCYFTPGDVSRNITEYLYLLRLDCFSINSVNDSISVRLYIHSQVEMFYLDEYQTFYM